MFVVFKFWDLHDCTIQNWVYLIAKLTCHISVQVQLAIAGVIAADTSAYKDQVASWDGEKRVVSK